MKNPKLLYIFFFLVITYLVINTGILSDDFDAMALTKTGSFIDNLIPRGALYFSDTPVMHLTHYIWYYFFSLYNAVAVNIVKIFYMIAAFYMIAQFFKIFMDEGMAILVSFLFIFFPSHDSTVYMFMNQYLTISFAFYLYAYYLAHRNKLILAFFSAVIGSFVSYGSTPIAIALFTLFVMNREFKKAVVIIVPNIIYSAYFVFLTVIRGMGHPRILETINVSTVIKQYLLQILTFADAMFGPSMWLKIYYAFFQLSIESIVAGVILSAACYYIIKRSDARYNGKLVISLLILLAISFLILAATGRYPQICFNLGNRITIYGALLLTYLIVLMPVTKWIRILISGLLIFTIMGISDHYKNWNIHQQKIIVNMRDNEALKNYRDTRVIYVAGNQYSKYGPISNIEFMSESWVPGSIFRLLFVQPMPASALNRRFKYEDGYLVDTKYNIKAEVPDYINVYDTDKNELIRVGAKDINSYIASLPADKRHWTQVIDNKYIKSIVLKLMPRLSYAI